MDKPLTICIDIRSLVEPMPSGVGLYTHNLIHALVADYPDVSFVLFANQYKATSESFTELKKRNNVRFAFSRIPSKILHSSFSLFGRPRIERLVGVCDVYFFPNIIFLPKLPRPSVLTVHDLSYIRTPSFYSLKSRLWHSSVQARRLIKGADVVVSVSHSTAHDLALTFPGVVPQVVSSAPFGLGKSAAGGEKKWYTSIGTLEERKNIHGLLTAFEQFHALHPAEPPLVIIGKRGFMKQATKNLLFKLVQKGLVIEKGYVSEPEKDTILNESKALVFVSLYEGFGFPGLEAEKKGIPIVASQHTSLPEVLGQGPVYVDPHSIEDIVRGLEQISHQHHVTYDNPLLERTWHDVAKEMMNIFINTHQTYAHRN